MWISGKISGICICIYISRTQFKIFYHELSCSFIIDELEKFRISEKNLRDLLVIFIEKFSSLRGFPFLLWVVPSHLSGVGSPFSAPIELSRWVTETETVLL